MTTFEDSQFLYEIIGATTTLQINGLASGSTMTNLVVPALVNHNSINYTVVQINSNAFQNNVTLQTFDMSVSSMVSIGSYAFDGCSLLTQVMFPSTFASFGDYAFQNCSILNSLTGFGTTQLTSIGDFIFFGCFQITQSSFTWPPNLTSIGYATFSKCGFTVLNLPTTLTSIGTFTFFNCLSLNTINGLGTNINLTFLGDILFEECPLITQSSFTWPPNLEGIGYSTFSKCGFTVLNLPNTLTSIGSFTFSNCLSLNTVNGFENNHLTSLGNDVFFRCINLKSISWPPNLTSIGNNTFDGCGFTVLNLPNTLTSIEIQTFSNCLSLNTVNASNTILTNMGSSTFSGCTSLTSVSFPTTLTVITSTPFTGCSSLTNVYFLGPYSALFDINAFPVLAPSSSLFYNVLYPAFESYTPTFTNHIPFTLIESIQTSPQNTTATITFPPILPSQYNKPITYTFTNTDTQTITDIVTEVNATQYTFQNLKPSSSYNFTMSINLNPEIQVVPISFSTLTVPISNICFAKNTWIQTDQGTVAIQNLSPLKHTIRGQKIKTITETYSLSDYMILFKPHAFEYNYPSKPTIVSPEHVIFYRGQRRQARHWLSFQNDKICPIKYNQECLYNILLGVPSWVLANNMNCETLHPKNIISKLCSLKNKKEITDKMNQFILKGHVEGYKKEALKLMIE